MRAFELSRSALSITAVTVLLSACGGGSSVPMATDNTIAGPSVLKHSQTFDYTGKKQTFIVPARVRQLTIIARGAQGGGRDPGPCGHLCNDNNTPGFPGRAYAIVPVHPGEKLYVFVGGSSGFNGGGPGGIAGGGSGVGQSGGGASDVRMGGDKLKDRIIVAAGGGGGGQFVGVYYQYAPGGNGGGLVGQSGGGEKYFIDGGGGAGGTQSEGGLGGAGGSTTPSYGNGRPGGNGKLGVGGSGGNGGSSSGSNYGLPGGGGGGGYYGGGGGGGGAVYTYSDYNNALSGGGGGGSSYVGPSAITSRIWSGWKTKGDGTVIFRWK